MAEDRSEPQETNWRQLLPWTLLFQGFRVARDPNKLVLAAAGIFALAFGWWLLAVIFGPSPASKPDYLKDYKSAQRWPEFRTDYQRWALLYETAGPPGSQEIVGAGDLATNATEYEALRGVEPDIQKGALTPAQALDKLVAEGKITRQRAEEWKAELGKAKSAGRLRTWPWFENRGPNPYLLVTGQAGSTWEPGRFLNWFLTEQVPVLTEPLVKLFLPVVYFFSPRGGLLSQFYFLLVMVWTLAVWALFGGAITRIAAVQVTRQEKIGALEALRFAARRYVSLLTAPLFPLVIVALIVVFMIIFGLFHLIPVFGDIFVDGLFWWIPVLLGLAMAVVLVGLVGWPLMAATISTEGTDTWEAVSRSYSYVFQAPWHFIFYGAVALVYGAVLVFFVGFMGSFMVYLAKWGVSQTPGVQLANRDPTYLFAYAPTSFGWRELLLEGGKVDGQNLVDNGRINEVAYKKLVGEHPEYTGNDKMTFYNKAGAFLVAFWLYLIFLLILGFGYSYFWSASTIIYLLMRRKVDDADLDEVYLEEEDQELPAAPPVSVPAPPPPAGPTMVEPPTLRPSPPPPPSPPTPAPSPPAREEVTRAASAPSPQQTPLPPEDRPATPPPPPSDSGTSGAGGMA